MKKYILLIIVCIAFPNLVFGSEYIDSDIAVYDKAIDITSHIDESLEMKSIKYHYFDNVLCDGVISYYNEVFSKSGHVPYSSDELGKGAWEVGDGEEKETVTKDDLPAKYTKSWVDNNHTIRYFLTVWVEPEDSCIRCSVECLVGNFYSLTPLNLFFKKLSKDEKEHIYSLVEKYSSKNGKMDIKKALEENEKDLLFLEFMQASEKVKK